MERISAGAGVLALAFFIGGWPHVSAFAMDKTKFQTLQQSCDRDKVFSACLELANDPSVKFAQKSVGDFYRKGGAVERDPAKAVYYYTKGVAEGDHTAESALADMYALGDGIAQDYAQALKYFQMAAKAGSARAHQFLGQMYFDGLGVEADIKQATEWMRKSQSISPNNFVLAEFLMRSNQNLAEAESLLTTCAENNTLRCQTLLGKIYSTDLYQRKSVAKARHWLETAYQTAVKEPKCNGKNESNHLATGVCAEAIREFARALYWGLGGTSDRPRALELNDSIEYGQRVEFPEYIRRNVSALTHSNFNSLDDWLTWKKDQVFSPSIMRKDQLPDIAEMGQKVGLNEPELFQPTSHAKHKIDRVFDMAILADQPSQYNSVLIHREVDIAANALAECGIGLRRVALYQHTHSGEIEPGELWFGRDVVLVRYTNRYGNSSLPFAKFENNMPTTLVVMLPGVTDENTVMWHYDHGSLAHELGHILGLPHPIDYEPSLMQYRYMQSNNFTPTQCKAMRSSGRLQAIPMVRSNTVRVPEDWPCAFHTDEDKKWLIENNPRLSVFCRIKRFTPELSNWVRVYKKSYFMCDLTPDELLKLADLAHNWNPDRPPITDRNTEISLKGMADLFWMTQEQIDYARGLFEEKRQSCLNAR